MKKIGHKQASMVQNIKMILLALAIVVLSLASTTLEEGEVLEAVPALVIGFGCIIVYKLLDEPEEEVKADLPDTYDVRLDLNIDNRADYPITAFQKEEEEVPEADNEKKTGTEEEKRPDG